MAHSDDLHEDVTAQKRAAIAAGVLATGLALGYASSTLPITSFGLAVGILIVLAAAISRPSWALALMLLMLPLEFFDLQLGPVGLSPIQIVAVIVLALLIASSLAKGDLDFPRTPLDVAIFLWVAVLFLGAIESLDPAAAIKKAGMTVIFAGVYYAIVAHVRTVKRTSWLVKVLVLACVIVAVYGIWVSYQYLATGSVARGAVVIKSEGLAAPRAASTIGNPNTLADLMVLSIPLALALFVIGDAKQKVLAALATAVLFVCLGFTFSRGAWLASLATLGVLMLDKRFRGVLAALGVALVAVSPGIIAERLASSAQLGRGEILSRFDYWEGALRMVQQRPLLGVGTANFPVNFSRLPVAETAMRTAIHAHNVFLNLLAENGVVGFIAYALLIGTALALALRRRGAPADATGSAIRLAIGASIIGYLVHQLTESLLLEPSLNAVVWTLMGFVVVLASIDAFQAEREPAPDRLGGAT